jgi:DNA-binding NtrC family response regulator
LIVQVSAGGLAGGSLKPRSNVKFLEKNRYSMGWTVLCVSKISAAQVTRNMILERAGYKVIAIANPEEAVRIFAASALDAVVFGDSIQPDQRNDLARSFKRLDSSIPIIALSKTSGSQVPPGIVDEQLESLGDPQLLLEALKRVLARDGDASARATPVQKGASAASSAAAGDPAIADRKTDPKAPKNSAI